MPAEEVPAELPEPCLGINFARDGMARKEWLALVAVHSDAWLMSVAFYYGAKLNIEQRYGFFLFGSIGTICLLLYIGGQAAQEDAWMNIMSRQCDEFDMLF